MNKITATRCLLVPALMVLTNCSPFRPSPGEDSGSRQQQPAASPEPAQVWVPEGFQVEIVASRLNFPSAVVQDAQQQLYVLEAGYADEHLILAPRLLRMDADGGSTLLAQGREHTYWTGITWHQDHFYITEENRRRGGRILRISHTGEITTLLEHRSDPGSLHAKGPLVKDGYLYFSLTSVSNGWQAETTYAGLEWLYRYPESYAASQSVQATYTAADLPHISLEKDLTYTAPKSRQEQPAGSIPCKGAIMRVSLKGGGAEVVAWGLRNPFGLALSPQNELYTTESNYSTRGNRPTWGSADVLWQINEGAWYGWPDFGGGLPQTSQDAKQANTALPALARHPNKPPRPSASLGADSHSNGLAFSHSPSFGFEGEAFIAQFGDASFGMNRTANPAACKVVRVNPETGQVSDFAANISLPEGAKSSASKRGLQHPVSLSFSPDGEVLYVVDLGTAKRQGEQKGPGTQTGLIWKISKKQLAD